MPKSSEVPGSGHGSGSVSKLNTDSKTWFYYFFSCRHAKVFRGSPGGIHAGGERGEVHDWAQVLRQSQAEGSDQVSTVQALIDLCGLRDLFVNFEWCLGRLLKNAWVNFLQMSGLIFGEMSGFIFDNYLDLFLRDVPYGLIFERCLDRFLGDVCTGMLLKMSVSEYRHAFLEQILEKPGSVTFWYGSGCGSGSSDPYLWRTDPDPALFVSDLQDANKKQYFYAFTFLKIYRQSG